MRDVREMRLRKAAVRMLLVAGAAILTIGGMVTDCGVWASDEDGMIEVRVDVGDHGAVDDQRELFTRKVASGGSCSLKIQADTGYVIETVRVNEEELSEREEEKIKGEKSASLPLELLTADVSVEVRFSEESSADVEGRYRVTTSAGTGGSITESFDYLGGTEDNVVVWEAADGFVVSQVFIDDELQEDETGKAKGSRTFISGNHTVKVHFSPDEGKADQEEAGAKTPDVAGEEQENPGSDTESGEQDENASDSEESGASEMNGTDASDAEGADAARDGETEGETEDGVPATSEGTPDGQIFPVAGSPVGSEEGTGRGETEDGTEHASEAAESAGKAEAGAGSGETEEDPPKAEDPSSEVKAEETERKAEEVPSPETEETAELRQTGPGQSTEGQGPKTGESLPGGVPAALLLMTACGILLLRRTWL